LAWTFLLIAGLLEIAWSCAMKVLDGFTHPWPTTIMVVTMFGSFRCLAVAMRTLSLGAAYTVWAGIGAVGAFLVGIVALGEQMNWIKLVAAGLIVCGLLLMNFAGEAPA
jgi:quaternary ammonium compound-resistance protein SugE